MTLSIIHVVITPPKPACVYMIAHLIGRSVSQHHYPIDQHLVCLALALPLPIPHQSSRQLPSAGRLLRSEPPIQPSHVVALHGRSHPRHLDTRVSIINVSSNFMVTALLGLVIFGEKLPALWWAGAGLLAAGNVVIGRREEGEKAVLREEGLEGNDGLTRTEAEEDGAEGVPLMGAGDGDDRGRENMIDLDGDVASAESTREAVKKGEDADAPLI